MSAGDYPCPPECSYADAHDGPLHATTVKFSIRISAKAWAVLAAALRGKDRPNA